MTDLDTSLVDALTESICKDTPISKSFANAVSIMKIDITAAADRMTQMRQFEKKLEELPRPTRRLSLYRLIRKVLADDRPNTKKPPHK